MTNASIDIQDLAVTVSRERFLPFCITIDKNFEINWHHRVIAEHLEKVERGEIKRLIIEMPPRHGKSTLASVLFPAWYLGKHPEREVITTSYSGELAKKFGGDTRDIFSDAQFRAVFDVNLKEDSQAKNLWTTDSGGSYTSVGRGGTTTGRGADLLIIDDPFSNREEAESKTIRESVWNWYTSTAYTRLEKGGAVVVIHTRWHTDDLIGRLLEKQEQGGDEWVRIRFPAIAEEDEPYRKAGEPLWPEKYDLDALQNIKANVGVYDWNALYQQNPITSETQLFHREWFKYFQDSDLVNKNLLVYATVDLAIGEKEQSDNTAICVFGKERNNPQIYVLDLYAGHLDPLQTIEYLFSIKSKYGSNFIKCGIESVAFQKALQYFIVEEQRKRQNYFDVIELKAKGAKETRIMGLIPMLKAGVIFFRNTYTELEEELLLFPKGKHDDRADALAYVQQVMEPTPKNMQAVQFYPKRR